MNDNGKDNDVVVDDDGDVGRIIIAGRIMCGNKRPRGQVDDDDDAAQQSMKDREYSHSPQTAAAASSLAEAPNNRKKLRKDAAATATTIECGTTTRRRNISEEEELVRRGIALLSTSDRNGRGNSNPHPVGGAVPNERRYEEPPPTPLAEASHNRRNGRETESTAATAAADAVDRLPPRAAGGTHNDETRLERRQNHRPRPPSPSTKTTNSFQFSSMSSLTSSSSTKTTCAEFAAAAAAEVEKEQRPRITVDRLRILFRCWMQKATLRLALCCGIMFLLLVTTAYCFSVVDPNTRVLAPTCDLFPRGNNHRKAAHDNSPPQQEQAPCTLRDILRDRDVGYHLAMAPAFFGFYGYFGALAAWMEEEEGTAGNGDGIGDDNNGGLPKMMRSVVGASAGAMTAILLSAGIAPQTAAAFCASLTVTQFADGPGLFALFRGNRFEGIMEDFLIRNYNPRDSWNTTAHETTTTTSLQMDQHAQLPVAVSALDIQTMRGQILQANISMARAARASATFPLLFQPVGWQNEGQDYLFVDGGLVDPAGLLGLSRTLQGRSSSSSSFATMQHRQQQHYQRVINLSVGGFLTSPPPGPSHIVVDEEKNNENQHHIQVVSISILGLPQPGPRSLGHGQWSESV